VTLPVAPRVGLRLAAHDDEIVGARAGQVFLERRAGYLRKRRLCRWLGRRRGDREGYPRAPGRGPVFDLDVLIAPDVQIALVLPGNRDDEADLRTDADRAPPEAAELSGDSAVMPSLSQYFRTIGLADAGSGAAGEIAKVSQAFHPSGLFWAANSL
jgi:hypothetical protein